MSIESGSIQGRILAVPEDHSPAAFIVMNDDGSSALRLEADGTVSGDLADRYPEAIPALKELGERIKTVMSRPLWSPYR